jgi:hypothetical protein
MFFNPIKGCNPENEKKLITFCISNLEQTENWAYLFCSIEIFRSVLNNNLKASNKLT